MLTALPGYEPVLAQDRRIFAAGRRHEAIAEAGMHGARGRLVEIDVDAAALVHEERTQIVDAVGVVGMLMRDQHAVEPIDLRVQELLAQIRRAVDQNARPAIGACTRSTNKSAAPPAVFRLVRIARAPAERDARHAHGGAAAENGEGEAHAAFAKVRGTLLNKRKKFSVVSQRYFVQRNAARCRQNFSGFGHIARLVAFAAIRQRRQIRCIGLDQNAVARQRGGDVAQALRILEGEDAGERHVMA